MPNLTEKQGVPEQRQDLSVAERLAMESSKQHAFEKMNGGCAISADVDETLKRLTAEVRPINENLAATVRYNAERVDAAGRKLEEIWADQMKNGANIVGVIDGTFHFFRNNEVLPDKNKALRIPLIAPDSVLGLRATERAAAQVELADFRDRLDLPWRREEEVVAVPAADIEGIVEGPANNPAGSFEVLATGGTEGSLI